MKKYIPSKRPLGYTYDAQGRELSYRHTDGTGWDYTYDAQGLELSCRHTDGTGDDYMCADSEYSLRSTLDDAYSAGCWYGYTKEQALKHWDRDDDRALLFTFAIYFFEATGL